jgi:tetratricopeptide (TPR) repeat protein
VGEDNVYALLARVHRELGETEEERAVLEELAARSGDATDAYPRLMELASSREDWEAVRKNAQRMLAVNPLVRTPHEYLAKAAEALNDAPAAIGAYRAVLNLDPFDPAETHYRLARLLRQQGEREEARRHVVLALEEAPRFRAAHRLLLELVNPPSRPSDEAKALP